MNNITIKQLRYFEALARHGHFGHAAAASAVSQPALSMQIKELETSLGSALFERSPRHVRLTAFGQEFATRARTILRLVDELGEFARATGDGPSGLLRLGVIPTIAPYFLPAVIARLTAEFPDLDIRVRETLTQKLIDELGDGKLDTAIVALPVSEPWLTETPLFDEDFVLIRPPADAADPAPDRAALADMRLLLLEEGHCFRDQALSFCNINSALPRDGLDGSSLSTLVQMVAAGMGTTLIPEMSVPVETRSANVAVTRFAGPQPARTIGMVWRKTSPLGDQLGQLADTVRQAGLDMRAAA